MSQTTILQRNAVERQREASFEAYHKWEFERRLYDEITDVAERVRAPISTTQEFLLSAEGLVSERGEPLRPIIVKGLAEAQRMAVTNPSWEVEVERRTIELEEYDDMEWLAISGEGALVSYWLIPDAVRNGESNLPGYNRERLKMFSRIAVPTTEGLAIKYHSYDQSYLPGVQAMDEALGFEFDASRGSEQIARERRFIDVRVDDIHELDEILRRAYDDALARDNGGEWESGRKPLQVKDVVGFISEQHSLLGEHMEELSKIFGEVSDPHQRNKRMEPHRYNLAAAIDDMLHGKQVTNAKDAGDGARSEGRNLDGDCSTGDETAEQQLSKVGFGNPRVERPRLWVKGECRTCLKERDVDVSQCHMCIGCENVHNIAGDAGLEQIIQEARKRREREQRFVARAKKLARTALRSVGTAFSKDK